MTCILKRLGLIGLVGGSLIFSKVIEAQSADLGIAPSMNSLDKDRSDEMQVAQSSQGRTAGKRRQRRGRKKSGQKTMGQEKSKTTQSTAVQSGIKAGAGLAFGIEGATPFMLGGDYIYPLVAVKNLAIAIGGNFWTYSVAGASVSFITIEGGVDYHYPVTAKGSLVGGGRLSYVNASGGNASDSKFGLTLLGGYEHNLGGSAVGGEFRMPMISDFDVTYAFGYYKFIF